nr:MAG TPA: hypothetical protein [Caudoviricetes sp.]
MRQSSSSLLNTYRTFVRCLHCSRGVSNCQLPKLVKVEFSTYSCTDFRKIAQSAFLFS